MPLADRISLMKLTHGINPFNKRMRESITRAGLQMDDIFLEKFR